MSLRSIVATDLGWKIFSVALAGVIWFAVRPVSREPVKVINLLSSTESRSFTNLPVVVMSSASDVRDFRVHPDIISVTVSGRPEFMAALTEKEIRVTVDLTEIESARMRARVVVAVPPGVTFIAAHPSEVSVVVPRKHDQEK